MLTVYRRPSFLFKDLNSMLDEIWNQDVQEHVDYAAKMHQDDSNFYVKITMPGFKVEEINVEAKDGILTILAEHKEENSSPRSFRSATSSFKKSFKLPKNINTDMIKADYRSGILLVSLPKVEVKESGKKITVTCSE